MSDGHVRVRNWEEFKRLVSEKKPKSLVYILEQNALSKQRAYNIENNIDARQALLHLS